MKKIFVIISLILCAAVVFASCSSSTPQEENGTDAAGEKNAVINTGFLKGPTGLGAVYLMKKSSVGASRAKYDIQTASDPSSFVAALINGELDIASLPVNAAAMLYAKTEGKVRMLAVNTLGVMYILDSSGTVDSLADLKGKTVLSAGQGSTPEYVLNYLLRANGLDPETDVRVEYAAEHAEVIAQALVGKYDTVLLPEPFVTKLMLQNGGFKLAVDLTEEWASLGKGELLTGCVAVRTAFAEEHPEEVKAFLEDYEESVNFALENTDEAAVLSGAFEITDEATAKAALPNCNITFMTENSMKENVKGFLEVLFEADPASVGGTMPGDDLFYLNADSEPQ